MEPDDYMDRELSEGAEYCWAHLMPIGDTGRGPVLVLGMPFLRTRKPPARPGLPAKHRKGTRRAASVNVQLPRLRKDLRTGSIS